VAVKTEKTGKTSITKVVTPKKKRNILLVLIFAIAGYFKGSWTELRQVMWPNRRATWGMTVAVLLFSGFFVLLIVSLDWIFNQLFNLIIK
jgi:preprotein translocase SecE subunit